MSERLDRSTGLFDLQRLNDWLHGFLMKFAPTPVEATVEDSDIDWEDGEIEDQTEGPAR